MNRLKLYLIGAIILLASWEAMGGITVNAGLTPAQDRWIMRMQYRNMYMYNSMMSSTNQMVPVVLAYGVTSNFTLMGRGLYRSQNVYVNNNTINSGIDDFYLLSKLKVYRKNTAKYSFGIAPFIATNIPAGNSALSAKTWNPEIGVSVSMRPRFWSFDLNALYRSCDITNKGGNGLNNNLEFHFAAAHQIVFNQNSSFSIFPVLESSYVNQNATAESNQSFERLFVSPGIQIMYKNYMIEALYQQPVYQNVVSNAVEVKYNFIIGTKIMF